MKKNVILLVAILSITYLKINGQNSENINFLDKWSITANSGISSEWGDVEANWFGSYKVKPGFGIVLTKELNSLFEIRGEAIMSNLTGEQPNRNRYFKANMFEVNIAGTVDFTRLSFGIDPCRKFIIHGIFGVGFYNFSSILRNINNDSIIYSTGYDYKGNKTGYQTEPVVNTGINIKVKVSRQVDLIFENTWTVTGNDYLDGLKGGFSYDIYSYTSIGISYKFNIRSNGKSFKDCGGGGAF